jgi:hypothetical protein
LIKVLEEQSYPLAVLTGLALFITGSLDLRVAYITFFVLCFYMLYYIFLVDPLADFRGKLRLIFLTFIPLVLMALLNFYWVIGSLSGESLLSGGTLARGLFGGISLNLKDAITLFYPFWNGSQPIWFVPQNIPFYFWIIPAVALLGLWLNRKNPKVLFFGFISILGIFLTKQTDVPLGGIYSWLFVHFPGFDAFREASKFYFLIALGYSVLIGSFIAFIWQRFTAKRWQRYTKYLIVFIVALLFLWNTKPLINGEIGTMWVPRHIEQDYITLNNFISKQPDYSVTLAVPSFSEWEVTTSNHPVMSLVQLGGANWEKFVDYADHDIYTWPIQDQIVDPLKKPFFSQLADNSSIKYVVVPMQDGQNDDNFSSYGGTQDPNLRQWYINQLDQMSWLKKIDIGTTELVVYENENYRPHIYTTAPPETIYQNIPYQDVSSTQINSTEYTVHLTNVTSSVFVNFSDSFDPNWKVHVGPFAWNDVFGANYFLPDAFHAESDATLNSFLIDPSYIRQNLPAAVYKVNPDGSIDVDLTLYFKPQSYFYVGLIVSGATLLACLGYLGWDFAKRRRKE